ncbi:hypothetical protein QJS66_15585 [Kocuria rhizophila]|nr:hypothetical protein QJS66_15585 [Kocuria rhizophila]
MFQDLRLALQLRLVRAVAHRLRRARGRVGGSAEAESLVGMAGPDSVVFHGDPLPEADPDKTKRRHAGSFTVAAAGRDPGLRASRGCRPAVPGGGGGGR